MASSATSSNEGDNDVVAVPAITHHLSGSTGVFENRICGEFLTPDDRVELLKVPELSNPFRLGAFYCRVHGTTLDVTTEDDHDETHLQQQQHRNNKHHHQQQKQPKGATSISAFGSETAAPAAATAATTTADDDSTVQDQQRRGQSDDLSFLMWYLEQEKFFSAAVYAGSEEGNPSTNPVRVGRMNKALLKRPVCGRNGKAF